MRPFPALVSVRHQGTGRQAGRLGELVEGRHLRVAFVLFALLAVAERDLPCTELKAPQATR